jgi:aldehyde dehydrogenase (NAD+)
MVGDYRLLVNGELTPASHGATYPNVNPATEEIIGEAADASASDVDAAIGAARSAFDRSDWSRDVRFRVHCLRQLQEALARHTGEFRTMTTAEAGIPYSLMDSVGFPIPVSGIGWVADLLHGYSFVEDLGDAEALGEFSHRWYEREPFGVVAAITPWNQPNQVNFAKVVPALAAGNTVVLKGAPATPWCASALARICALETDLPAGVLNVITAQAAERGEQLVLDARVDLISFTGSTAIGRQIMRAAAESVKKVFLELGGKSANIVLSDADLASAVRVSATHAVAHGGQACAALTRLLLPAERYDEGLELAADAMAQLPYGDPTNPTNLMGPLISQEQRERVEGFVDRAVASGARVVLGGRRPEHIRKGFFYEPTLLANVDPEAEIAQSEVFGPVLVVIPYEGEDDAIRIANGTIYGLSAAVFSADHERAKRVARRLRSGTVIVNGGQYYSPDVAFGGYKQSGIGREMGRAGFEEYLQIKVMTEPATQPSFAM